MSVWQLSVHVFHFLLPAMAMALLMPWAGQWVVGSDRFSLRRRIGVQFLSGLSVLVAGLWLQGQDGKMSTYMVLILVAASAEWLMQRGYAPR